MRERESGLTGAELGVMEHLVAAWDGYVSLPVQHPADLGEFMGALHELQRLLAVRVVRREHPKYWRLRQDDEEA